MPCWVDHGPLHRAPCGEPSRIERPMTTAQIAPQQRDAVAFLANPASYPSMPPVERIDTHGAHVFLCGSDVFKIKRAIRYPYMDFSTLEKRHAACVRELEVNAPNAPMIYKSVVAITRAHNGRMAFAGDGDPVEWAVHMARFHEGDVLANRIVSEPLADQEAKALADAVYAAHAAAIVIQQPPPAAQISRVAADVLAALTSLFGPEDQTTVAGLRARLTSGATDLSDLLVRRARDGHVRRCHGDLHLGNIVLIDGHPTLFDAIEFDETLATIDTLYDLAFLLMDLDHRDHRETANAVLNRYLWRSQALSNIEALAALPVFLALRAAIRAMVGAQKASLSTQPSTEPRGYLQRALSYLHEEAPALVLIGGLSGSGKSTLAAALAPSFGRAPGALHLRSDLERKALFNADEFQRLPASAYTASATAAVYDRMLTKAQSALHAGHSVIADAVHADPRERIAIAALAGVTGARLASLWLDVPANVLIERVAQRKNDASDATPQVVEQQLVYGLGPLDWTRLDASGPFEETLRMAMSHLHASFDKR